MSEPGALDLVIIINWIECHIQTGKLTVGFERHNITLSAASNSVISVGLATRDGKLLFSRQFIPIKKSLVESLFLQFSRKLPHSNAANGAALDHSIFEDNTCRYIVHPLDSSVLLIIITVLSSNVLLDFQQLRALAVLISSLGGEKNRVIGVDGIKSMAFPIINAIDEFFLPLSLPDAPSVTSIQAALEMYSQAEKMEELLIKDKEREAKERSKEKAREIEALKREKKLAASQARQLQPEFLSRQAPQVTVNARPVYGTSPPPVTSAVKGGGLQLSRKKSTISSSLLETSPHSESASLNNTRDAF